MGGGGRGRKPKLGSGARFRKLAAETSPAIAAVAGRKKYGSKRMAEMAAAGRRRRTRSE